MATAAQSVPGFDVPAADAMDLQSEDGYDMEEGDIDIDLGSTHGSQMAVEDDAISLQDAGTDAGTDMHDAPGDVDDFMVDKEDLIEEDVIDYDDVEIQDVSFAEDTSFVPNPSSHASDINDEDLIDYSDEEDEGDQPEQTLVPEVQEERQDNNDLQDQVDIDASAVSAPEALETSANDDDDVGQEHHAAAGAAELGDQPRNAPEMAQEEQLPPRQHEEYSHPEGNHETFDQEHIESSQGQRDHEDIKLGEKSETEPVNVSVQEQSVQEDGDYEAKGEAALEPNGESPSPLHSVTVNYEGSELWLFKPLDSAEDDWLLEDASVAAQNFPYFFHACRAALGEDINNETELGLRFDNFHGLELFEDCTACAYSTLEEFINIYTALHAQDGDNDPEPFYITLQFRPRVVSLISELKKAVQDGIGFSGLNNAITSGQSSFNNTFLDVQEIDDYEESWDEEEPDAQEEEAPQEELETEHKADAEKIEGEDAAAQSATEPAEQLDNPDTSSHVHADANAGSADTENNADDLNVGHTDDVSRPTPPGQSHRSPSVPVSHHSEPHGDELIEYSDEEDEATAAHNGESPAISGTSASSTVQGDKISPTSNHLGDNEGNDVHDDVAQVDNGVEQSYDQYDDATVDENEHYDEHSFTDAYEQGFETGDYTAPDFDAGDDEYEYDNAGTTVNDGQNDMSGGGEADNLNTVGIINIDEDGEISFNNVDASAGLEEESEITATENASAFPDGDGEDLINFDDEEGAEDTAFGATSSAAPAAVASSTGVDHQGSSPQGLKRPLDEVDVGLDGAGDETDAKKQKL